MHANQLNAAQLMMSYLSEEHGKLGRKIVASEFSEELRMQHDELNSSATALFPVSGQDVLGKDSLNGESKSVRQSCPNSGTTCTENRAVRNADKIVMRMDRKISHSPERISKELVKEKLLFANSAVAESIMAQMAIPAEVMQTCKNAEDRHGRLSLKALCAAINHQGNPESGATQTAAVQTKISVQDVKALIDSLCQIKGESAAQPVPFKTKETGYYSPDELKGLLEAITEEVTNRKAMAASKADRNLQEQIINEDRAPVEAARPNSIASGLVERLNENIMPSFTEDPGGTQGISLSKGFPQTRREKENVVSAAGISSKPNYMEVEGEARGAAPAGEKAQEIRTSEKSIGVILSQFGFRGIPSAIGGIKLGTALANAAESQTFDSGQIKGLINEPATNSSELSGLNPFGKPELNGGLMSAATVAWASLKDEAGWKNGAAHYLAAEAEKEIAPAVASNGGESIEDNGDYHFGELTIDNTSGIDEQKDTLSHGKGYEQAYGGEKSQEQDLGFYRPVHGVERFKITAQGDPGHSIHAGIIDAPQQNAQLDSATSTARQSRLNYFSTGTDNRVAEEADQIKLRVNGKPSQRPLRITKELVKENLIFTDPAAAEKVMAQMGVPAEARQVGKNAEDSNECISLKAFSDAVNYQGNSEPAAAQPLTVRTKIAVQDVKALIDSLCRVKGESATQPVQIKTKATGYYSPDEIKGLLEEVAEQVISLKTPAASKSGDNLQELANSAEIAPVEAAHSDPIVGGLVEGMNENVLPSFIEDYSGKQGGSGSEVIRENQNEKQNGVESDARLSKHGHVMAQVKSAGHTDEESQDIRMVEKRNGGTLSPLGFVEGASATDGERPGAPFNKAKEVGSFDASSNVRSTASESQTFDNVGKKGLISELTINSSASTGLPDAGKLDTNSGLMTEAAPAGVSLKNEEGWSNGKVNHLAVETENEIATAVGSNRKDAAEDNGENPFGDRTVNHMVGIDGQKDTLSHRRGFPQPYGGERPQEQVLGSFRPDRGGEKFKITAQGDPGNAMQSEIINAAQQNAPLGPTKASVRETLSLSGSSWQYELSNKMLELHRQKRNQLTIELEPQNLGKMVLRVEADQNQVNAWISTSSEQVRTLLAQNAPILRQHLHDQGLMLGQFSVGVSDGKGNQQPNQQKSSGGRRSSMTPKVQQAERGNVPVNTSLYQRGSGERLISVFA
ncbi:MAG: flagellar hook-length control protein FliK [Syntrophobacteraceae bacterium]